MADQQIGNSARGVPGLANAQKQFTERFPGVSESIRAGAPVGLDSDGLPRYASAASDTPELWPTMGLARKGGQLGTFEENGGGFDVQFGSSLELLDPEVEEVNDDGPVFLIGSWYYVSTTPGKLTATPPSTGNAITPIAFAVAENRLLIVPQAPVTAP